MIFKFRLVSDEVDNFKREIQIDANATFFDLHTAICEAVGYDKNVMCSFFLCDEDWDKEKEITLTDMDLDSDVDAFIMDECVLADYIEDEGAHLMFTFDYLNDRSFYIEMKEMVTGRSLLEPVCSLSLGTPPAQEKEPEAFIKEVTTKTSKKQTTLEDFNDTLDEEVGFNPDEFDEEGFSEMSFDD